MSVAACDPNEDHEKYAGSVTKDPWDDEDQPDWPNNPKGVTDAVGSDKRPDSLS